MSMDAVAPSPQDDRSSETYLFGEEDQAWNCIRSIQTDVGALPRLQMIFDRYLECPTLLDPSLERFVNELAQVSCPLALRALYSLCKVRGYKTVRRFLPHTVEYVELVWRALQQQQQQQPTVQTPPDDDDVVIPSNTESPTQSPTDRWEVLYVLWHWMAALSLVPFPMSTIGDWLPHLLDCARDQLSTPGPTQEAAASCLAAWLIRHDCTFYWDVFLPWATGEVILPFREQPQQQQTQTKLPETGLNPKHSQLNPSELQFAMLGVLRTLTTVLKSSSFRQSQWLLDRLTPLWDTFLRIDTGATLMQKMCVKLWTRMACAHLPVRVASWRYQRGKRTLLEMTTKDSLISSSSSSTVETTNHSSSTASSETTFELFPIPDLVEETMGRLLESVHHSATVVRWSAAKGIGRVTERLPAICATDVVEALLDYDRDNEHHIQGTCLTVAELARRGLLLPPILPDVVPHVIRAIYWDRSATVRDAACYTYWAFGRAYAPNLLAPFLSQLSAAVIVTCLFDREVNCRRAASAAFQEAVGRQGSTNFPNGIAIVTATDFYSIGNRTAAYTDIAWNVAEFHEYRRPIIQHLYSVKLAHWDIHIRQLASKSLQGLVKLDSPFFCSTVIPYLLAKSLDATNLPVRHGAVLGVAEIVFALGRLRQLSLLSHQDTAQLKALVGTIEKKRLYRGRGGEVMRSAVCRLIECLSLTDLSLTVQEQVQLLDSVDANISHPSETIQIDACKALEQLLISHFPVKSSGPTQRLQARVVDKFIKECLTNDNPAATRGYGMALGFVPRKLIATNTTVLDQVLDCLIQVSRHDSLVGGESDAETRRNALQSLTRIVKEVGLTPLRELAEFPVVCIETHQTLKVIYAFLMALDDYKTDRRGDVGSWCRMAAMEGLTVIVPLASASQEMHLHLMDGLATTVISALLRQLGEKLDTIRQRAGETLKHILGQENVPGINARHELCRNLELDISSTNWSDPSVTFPMVMKVASMKDAESYFKSVIAGVVISSGSLTDAVSKQASAAVLKFSKECSIDMLKELWTVLVHIYEKEKCNMRVIPALLKTLNVLISNKTFDRFILSDQDCGLTVLLNLLENTSNNCQDVSTLFKVIEVSVSLLAVLDGDGVAYRKAMTLVLKNLGHPYPRVRSYTAHLIYVILLDAADDEIVLDTLLQTNWTSDDSGMITRKIGELSKLLKC